MDVGMHPSPTPASTPQKGFLGAIGMSSVWGTIPMKQFEHSHHQPALEQPRAYY